VNVRGMDTHKMSLFLLAVIMAVLVVYGAMATS
jgi:hypothetical protein